VDVVCDDDAQAMFEDWALFVATQAPAHKLHLFVGPPPPLGDARGPSSGLSSQSGMLLCANGSADAASPSGGSSPIGGGHAWGDAAGGDIAKVYEGVEGEEEEEDIWEECALDGGAGAGGAGGGGAFAPSSPAAAGGSAGTLCASPRVDLMALAARLEVIPPEELRVVRLLGCGGFGEARGRPASRRLLFLCAAAARARSSAPAASGAPHLKSPARFPPSSRRSTWRAGTPPTWR
jgi:hypothetical protein